MEKFNKDDMVRYWHNREHLINLENQLRKFEFYLEKETQSDYYNYDDEMKQLSIRKAQYDIDNQKYQINKHIKESSTMGFTSEELEILNKIGKKKIIK